MGAMLEDAISGQLTPYGQTTANRSATPPVVPTSIQISASEIPASAPPQSQASDGLLQQTSFDCTKAQSIPEYLICHDPDLAAADRELEQIYEQAKTSAHDQDAFKERIRKQWNYREKNCRDKACLLSWYAYQKDVLSKIAQTGDVNAQQ